MNDQSTNNTAAQILRSHPALAVTLLYALVSAIGLLFNWSLFREFDVNVFNFMEVGDFLLAALREPLTFLLSGSALVATYLIYRLSVVELGWLSKRKSQSRFWAGYHRFSRAVNTNALTPLVAFLAYCYLFLSLYAEWKSEQVRDGTGRQVMVELATPSNLVEQRPMALLGATNRFVFLYDVIDGQTHIIPHENLATVTPVPGADNSASDASPDR